VIRLQQQHQQQRRPLRYAEVFKGINPESLTSTGAQATTFFKDLIYSEKLYDKMDIIHNALLNSVVPGKDCLLRNAIRQISVKGRKNPCWIAIRFIRST
jgi:hypothetical protein